MSIARVPDEQADTGTPSLPRGYAVVVGIGRYKNLDPAKALRFSETDAEAVYRVLISKAGGAFPAENVHLLVGARATLANIRYELEDWLPSVAGPSDRVIVYFAGHGLVKGGEGYLAPWDVDTADSENTAYPMALLGKALAQKVNARWKVLLVDACHSGKITPESTDDSVDAQFSQLPKSFLTLTATREREQSFEDPKLSTGFGLFSYYLVQGLQGNADNDPCDGVITADELIEYVRSEVKKYAHDRGAFQTPTEHGDFENNMSLGWNPGCGGKAAASALALGSIVVESNMDDVEVFLDDKLVGKVAKDTPLKLPGLSTGVHIIKGVREGYDPYTKQEIVMPGQEHTVTLRIQYRREYRRSASDSVRRGEELLFRPNLARNTINPFAIYAPSRQTQDQLLRGRELFSAALKEEPEYAQAAYDLGLTCQLLSDSKGMLDAFSRSIQSDPSYVDARVDYAGALIEEGDPDEAIRQLLEAIRLDPRRDTAYSHLSRAYLDKGIWNLAIEAADKALALNPASHQAYLWKADALRRASAAENGAAIKLSQYSRALDTYESYLRLTNFSTPLYEKIAYFGGFGLGGSRRRADRPVTYAYQRNIAFMGLCECENKLGNPLRAIGYCQRAIHYDPKEPMAYFLLGNVYRDLFNQTHTRENLLTARSNYAKMIEINPDLDLSLHAKNYLEQIDVILPKLRR